MSYLPPHLRRRQPISSSPDSASPTPAIVSSTSAPHKTAPNDSSTAKQQSASSSTRMRNTSYSKPNMSSIPLVQPSDRHASEATLQARALRFGSPSPDSPPSRRTNLTMQHLSPAHEASNISSSPSRFKSTHSTFENRTEFDLAAEDRQMESLGTLSRSGGVSSPNRPTRSVVNQDGPRNGEGQAGILLGEDGDALKDEGVQERYMAYIDRRLVRFGQLHPTYLSSSLHRAAALPPFPPSDFSSPSSPSISSSSSNTNMTTSATRAAEDMSSIMLCFRKLREGVLASGREDGFALRVYERSAAYALLSANHPQIVSSLSILVPGLYTRTATSRQDSSSTLEQAGTLSAHLHDDLAGLTISDQTSGSRGASDGPSSGSDVDSRGLYACLLLTYTICHLGDVRGWWKLWFKLTLSPSRASRRVYGPTGVDSGEKERLERRGDEFVFASDPYMVLAKEAFEAFTAPSSLRFAALIRQKARNEASEVDSEAKKLEDGLLRATLAFGEAKLRERSWAIVRGAYRDLGARWASRLLMLGDDQGDMERTDTEILDEWEDGKLLADVRTWVEAHGARVEGAKVIIRG